MKTGLYLHVPLCRRKCGYCDFYSEPIDRHQPTALIRTMLCELDRRESSAGQPFQTIYVGGGTPTILPPQDLRLLMNRLREIARKNPVIEFTVEANPTTVDTDTINLLVDSGVNRISIGAQSFHTNELEVLERTHAPQDVESAVCLARQGKISQVNLDLIFGIPSQTLETWEESLRRAVNLGVDHVSCYGLTYEPQTRLADQLNRGLIQRCDEDLEADMYELCRTFLAEYGYEQYEISNFAHHGCMCQHNLIYWHNWPYLGIGPSAASYLNGVRFTSIADIHQYMDNVQHDCPTWRESERLTGIRLAGETAMLMLRMNRGIDVALFRQQVGLDPLTIFRESLQPHVNSGRVEITEEFIRLTHRGRLVANRILADLLVDPPECSDPPFSHLS